MTKEEEAWKPSLEPSLKPYNTEIKGSIKSKEKIPQQAVEDNKYNELLKKVQELEDRIEWLEFREARCWNHE